MSTKRGTEWEAQVRAAANLVEGTRGALVLGEENPVAGWRMLPVGATVDRQALPLFDTGDSDRQTVEKRNLCLYLLRVGRHPVERAAIFAWYDVGGLCAVGRSESRSVKALFWLKEIEKVRLTASLVRAMDFAVRVRPHALSFMVRVRASGAAERDLLEKMKKRALAADVAAGCRRRRVRLSRSSES